MRLQPWRLDFHPFTQKTTRVCFSDGSWEYSHPRILTDIGRGIGTPLQIDRATLEGHYGHFARVLLGISFSSPTTTYRIGHSLVFPSRLLQSFIKPYFLTLSSAIGHTPAEHSASKDPFYWQGNQTSKQATS